MLMVMASMHVHLHLHTNIQSSFQRDLGQYQPYKGHSITCI